MELTEEQKQGLKDLCIKAVLDDEERAVPDVTQLIEDFVQKANKETITDQIAELAVRLYDMGFKAGVNVGVSTAARAAALLMEGKKDGT